MLLEYAEYIVGIPTLIISSILAWYFFYKQKKYKQLSYEIENISTVIDHKNLKNYDIEVLYKKTKVSYLEMITIRIVNNGNIPITEKDFVKPLAFNFGSAKILSARFEDIDKLETTVNIKTTKDSGILEVFFDLLNPRENIQVEAFLDEKATINVSGRIIGINKIKYLEKANYLLLFMIGIMLLLLISSLVFLIFSNAMDKLPIMAKYITIFGSILYIIIMASIFIKNLPNRGKKNQIDLNKKRRIR